jgi:uncharacterized membrane protein YphA (DoxX/SURF4 family)
MNEITIFLQALVAVSIFFVWVVRYENIVEEFKHYRLPEWMRDLVGILKLTLALLLVLGVSNPRYAVIGGVGIAVLMLGAFVTHHRVKSPIVKRLPCLGLLVVACVIAWANFGTSS